MKVILRTSLLLFFAMTLHFANAQVNLGVKGGVNITTVKGPDILDDLGFIPEFQSIQTYSYGLVSEFELGQHFSFQPELTYATKGFKLEEQMDVNIFNVPIPLGATAITEFNYLEMPVLAKARTGNEHFEAYVMAGPAVGYALNGKLTTRAKVLVELDLFETDINLEDINYERLELSGVVGAGVALKMPIGKIFVDGRYQHGFTEVYDIPLLTDRVENRGYGVNAGVVFNL